MARKQREIWVADCETDPFKAGRIPKPFVWGAYNGELYEQFEDTREFVEYITDIDCIVYAHNGGKFDWHFILEYLDEFTDVMVISGRIAKFKIGKAEFRDSYNIIPVPLGAFQKDEIDYNLMEEEKRYKQENWSAITKYLRSDCVYLYELVKSFIDNYGLHLTQAGASIKMWEKICNEKAPKTNASFYSEFSQYYYGGRVECFETGIINDDFDVIDINSAYPYAMKHLHPYGADTIETDELPDNDGELSRAFIRLRAKSLGAFPYRTKTGLDFPNDGEYREFYITGWEYLSARDTNTLEVDEIISVTTFTDTIEFSGYINHFYALKEQAGIDGDKALYLFAKLFLNSLYGKFGANPDKYNEFIIVNMCNIEGAIEDGYEFSAEVGEFALMSRPLDECKKRYFNVAVAASITGFVRAYLFRAIKKCEGVIYCDTDSISAREIGDLKLDPNELGAWDVEARCTYGAVAGKKLYAFKCDDGSFKKASKGVRLDAEDIIKVAEGEKVSYTSEAPNFSLKRGISFITREVKRVER